MRTFRTILALVAWAAGIGAAGLSGGPALGAPVAEYFVYSVFKGLDFGNPGETPQKDFYVNMGSAQGIRNGSSLQVLRRMATYDLTSQKLYKDVTFPIARLKVIHVEGNAAIARLEKMNPANEIPALANPGVMVGDIVKLAD